MANAPLNPMQQVMEWIGFDIPAQRDALAQELGDLQSVGELTYKEIRDLRDGYAKRTVAEGRIHFGLQRTKRIKALTEWVNDQARIDRDPTIGGFTQATFIDALTESADRAAILKADEETMDTRAKEAAPGMLTGENVWEKWEAKLNNMLSIQTGIFGVPLAYVIREKVNPDPGTTYDTFMEECIAKAPLQGPKFEADARKVHQIIVSYTTGENAEQWVKPHMKKENGRTDMEALRAYYRGEGNQTRRVSNADKLRDTLHYKSEGAMPFATFLDKCQRMFNMYEETGEPYTEAAKIRFLFDKVQNTELRPAIESLKARLVSDPDAFTFATASNHLAAQVKPKSMRGLSAVGTDPSRAEIMKDGKIFTGFYKNWASISSANKKLVIAERERLGIASKKKKDGGKKLKSLKAQVKSLKQDVAKISAIKRKDDGASDGSDASSDDESTNHAGNSFGGRNEKAKKRSKRSNNSNN